MKHVWRTLIVLVFFLGALPVYQSGQAQDDAPVTLDIAASSPLQFDPLLAYDDLSLDAVESLYLGLTDIDPISNQIVPELAIDWTISDDGLTWTFNLRDDVNWVQYDPATGEVVTVRPVVANDFVYGIKRACDPRIEGSYAGYTIGHYIAGCAKVRDTASNQASDELVYGDTTRVSAPDDTTVVFELTQRSGGFLGLTTEPAMRAVPFEMVAEHGSGWESLALGPTPDCTVSSSSTVNLRAEPSTTAEQVGRLDPDQDMGAVAQTTGTDGYVWWFLALGGDTNAYVRADVVNATGNCATLPDVNAYDPAAASDVLFMTDGPYTWSRGGTFVVNRHLPADLQITGNIEEVNIHLAGNVDDLVKYYNYHRLDAIPLDSNDPADFVDGLIYENPFPLTRGFVFAYDKPPFDNVYVRRAFSAILDRHAFINQGLDGQGIPMTHMIPNGTPNAPDEMSDPLGFDPEFAQESMTQAGYPGCQGFPEITIAADPYAEIMAISWKHAVISYLGCDAARILVETLDYSDIYEMISPDAPVEDRPNAWTLTWGAHYGDPGEWFKGVMACGENTSYKRPCTDVDDLLDEAARSSDLEERAALYAEIEEAFFGPEGEFPIVPLYMQNFSALHKPWYTGPFETDGLFAGRHWGAQSIDMDIKLAARGEHSGVTFPF